MSSEDRNSRASRVTECWTELTRVLTSTAVEEETRDWRCSDSRSKGDVSEEATAAVGIRSRRAKRAGSERTGEALKAQGGSPAQGSH